MTTDKIAMTRNASIEGKFRVDGIGCVAVHKTVHVSLSFTPLHGAELIAAPLLKRVTARQLLTEADV